MRSIDETILVNKSLPKSWTCPHCGKRNLMGKYKYVTGVIDIEDYVTGVIDDDKQ